MDAYIYVDILVKNQSIIFDVGNKTASLFKLDLRRQIKCTVHVMALLSKSAMVNVYYIGVYE